MGNKLGEGSFGIVYKGWWKGSIDVAIKTMSRSYQAQEFMKEANVMKKLDHPHVVKFYGVLQSPSSVSIVLEYMEGGSLLSVLKTRKSNIPCTQLLKFCSEVCSGMDYLHSENTIHRDLAARNCLVAQDLVVKIADFGLSRYVPDTTYYQSTYGVFARRWMPPEVYERKFTKKADVWAFEIIQRVMKQCWKYNKEDRPSFSDLSKKLASALTSEESYKAPLWIMVEANQFEEDEE
ncbi:hypothetical protein J437_LFUL019295 [Ladona fulva]|uniref:Protein kinase domain-containing protein n=1 Tax=Ladona fulva TaxID=123851 RepID=A0A8K0PB03_LADFU|nr:hypothetical protein J437_LFUL019295 [Ladona fulva]